MMFACTSGCGCHGDRTPCHALSLHELGLCHRRAAKMTLDTLRIGQIQAFHRLGLYLTATLSPGECRGLALAGLLACKEEGGQDVVEVVFPGLLGAGMPLPPLTNEQVELDAALWAASATARELRAYLIAAARQLPPKMRFALFTQLLAQLMRHP